MGKAGRLQEFYDVGKKTQNLITDKTQFCLFVEGLRVV